MWACIKQLFMSCGYKQWYLCILVCLQMYCPRSEYNFHLASYPVLQELQHQTRAMFISQNWRYVYLCNANLTCRTHWQLNSEKEKVLPFILALSEDAFHLGFYTITSFKSHGKGYETLARMCWLPFNHYATVVWSVLLVIMFLSYFSLLTRAN